MVSTKRYAAVIALLLVGVLCTQAVGGISGMQTTYDATRVDPATDAAQIAAHDPDVVALNDWIDSMPPEADTVIRQAIENGTYSGDVPPELHMRLEDYDNESTIAVYRGEYYRMNVTVAEETTDARITITPITAADAARAVATPYADANATIRHAIQSGSATTDQIVVEQGLVSKDDAYYLVVPQNEGAVIGKFFAMLGGFVLNPIGYAYGTAALVLLGALRVRQVARPLVERDPFVAMAGTVLILWFWTTVTGSGTIGLRYVVYPLVGAVAALGLLAGIYFRGQAWRRLAVLTVGTPVVGIGAALVSVGAYGILFGSLALVVGWFGSLPLVGYGYAFADGSDAESAIQV